MPESRSGSKAAAIFVLAALTVAIGALESMPIPALPLIQRELGLDPAQAALLTTTLLLTGSVTMPIIAKLADARGGLRVLVALSWCIVVGGAVSAFAGSLPLMVFGQFMQGLGIAVVPVSFVVVRELFPERMAVAVGVITGCFTVGGGVGVLSAGPLADAWSRRWMFLLPTLLVTVLAFVAQFAFRRAARPGSAARLDWAGAVLLAGALAALTLNLAWIPQNGWFSAPTGILLVLTLVFGTAWVVVERRVADPMVDLRMLGRRGVWSSSVVAAVLGVGYAVPYFLFPQLLAMPPSVAGFGFGASASVISLYLFPAVAVAVLVGPVTGLLVRRVGSRAVVAGGLVVTGCGIVFAAFWHSAPWHIVVSMLLTIGLGVGAAFTALYTGVIDAVEAADTGVATAINGIARGIGLSLGVQLSAVIISAGADPSTHLPSEASFRTGFFLSAVLVLIPLAVVRFVPGSRAVAGLVRSAKAREATH
ncbi:MFS transporter [Amycolatopsis jejuensis]|uniref:MFS transporter n=1 Tax=Amycolatopsis jejuensis TaxID=330084 RepID=UPI00068DC5C4|nr:MFS transporter [Amycolatopsis jejuensis]